MACLKADKALIQIFLEYLDYANVFLADLKIKLPKHNVMNNHIIELIKSKQLPYGPTYNLSPVELKTLKIYIETHLKTGSI